MNNTDKLELYNKAKEAYYNGEEIMSDLEFDALEKELDLENKSEVGSKHNPSYTIHHPYIMGSISKVQIHEDKDGNVDWQKYFDEMKKYTIHDECNYIITPKYDGCSFEIYVKNGNYTISSRGDGEYGKDLRKYIWRFIPQSLFRLSDEFTLRGEVLVKKSVFESKYADTFTNPRSFVSGVLNHEYEQERTFIDKVNDLSIVIYDYRIYDKEHDKWEDYDWTEIIPRITSDSSFFASDIDKIQSILPAYYKIYPVHVDPDYLTYVYKEFDDYRKECDYALDGIVIKPTQDYRINNITEKRAKDCVAIKFIPMLEETEVTNIEWKISKTCELIPTIHIKPVIMDGKVITKCSGHNYGYLINNKISISTKVILSLAGDIIPFLYKVTDSSAYDINKLCIDDSVLTYIDGCHLMTNLTNEERIKNRFINSAVTLNIPNIGEATANSIYEYVSTQDEMTMEFFNESSVDIPDNILLIANDDVYFGAGAGKAGHNAKKSYVDFVNNISLADIIKSCCFRFCGERMSKQIEAKFLGLPYDFSHMTQDGWKWTDDVNSPEMIQIMKILNYLGKNIDDFKKSKSEELKTVSNQIPVILTGEPNNYNSKGEFLKLNPQYRLTGSWKEVKIVFTNSMDSNTGKMKKAKEKGIEIQLY